LSRSPFARPSRLAASLLAVSIAGAAVAAPSVTARPADAPAVAKASAKSSPKKKAKSGRRAARRPAAYRRCGRSFSPKRIARTTTSVNRRTGARTVTRLYCDGSKRIVTRYPQQPPQTIYVPAPAPQQPAPQQPAPQQPAPQDPRPHDPTPAKPGFRLTLLHNNDGESKYQVGDSIAGYGGVATFKTVLDRLRADADAYTDAEVRSGATRKGTVVLSSGDNILAGLNLRASFERRDAGRGPFYDVPALAAIGYDAVTIGNHEYDFGPLRLAQLIGDMPASTPFLSVNSDFSAEPALQALVTAGKIARSTVVEKDGEKIGVIGATTPDTPSVSSPGGVTFSAQVADAVNAEADRLTQAGVNKIILSSHLQNVANERTVVAQLRNVDVVIAGGGDELLANADDRRVNADLPVGPYPALAQDSTGATVPIVTTQGEYRYVGRLTALFDSEGRLTAIDDTRSGPVRVSATQADPDYAAPDAAVQAAVVDPLRAFSAELAARVIGTTEQRLNGDNPNPIRLSESNLGDLVADGFRYATNKAQRASGGPIAQVAFSNGGGIRRSIEAGDISEKSTFDVLPFDNTMVTVTGVTPARLKALMEHGVASLPAANGRFPQISGFRMTVSVSAPVGSRVTDIELLDGTDVVVGGAVAPGAPTVNLATTNFTAGFTTGGAGGDGYPFEGLDMVAARSGGGFLPYQQTLYQYITDPTTSEVAGQRGLGGEVTAASHPGSGRITITP